MLGVAEETFTFTDADVHEPLLCESHYHAVRKAMGPHPAHWYAICRCGRVIALCDRRKVEADAFDGWMCIVGEGHCGEWHHRDEITWTPLDKPRVTP